MELTSLRWWRSTHFKGLIAGIYIGAAYLALGAFSKRADASDPGRHWALLALTLACAVALLVWAATLRRARSIADIPTSRIASAAQGYVELQGRTVASNLIFSPLSKTACIWYRYQVYEREAGKDRQWREVDSGTSSATFDLDDGSGQCTVDPDYAEVIGAEVSTRYLDNIKQVEELLHGGRTLFALGEFTTVGGANAELNLHDDVNVLLAQWKQDQGELLRRFDLNHDGVVDQQEWELARRLATGTVEKEHRAIRERTGVNMLRSPQDGRPFLLSPLSGQSLRRRYLIWSALHMAVALGAAYIASRLLVRS